MKRPDQHNIDPSEAGATDYKTLPQTGRGNSSHLDTVHQDKQRLEESRQEAKSGQPFLPDVPAPSAHANRGKLEKDVDDALHGKGAKDAESDPGNPLV